MSDMRLQKFLSQAGFASRRHAEELIRAGKVLLNNQVAQLGDKVNLDKDEVVIAGQKITITNDLRYFLVYKPTGVVSTTTDELGRTTVLSLLPKEITQKYSLYPVGRLDLDSEGLVLLTNDGELTHRLTHPKFEIPKTYQVLLDRTPSHLALEHLRKGVRLKEGMTSPAQVELLEQEGDRQWLEITIHEGRNHQVKRMTERVGYETLRLIRTELGPFTLKDLDGHGYLELSARYVEEKLRKSL